MNSFLKNSLETETLLNNTPKNFIDFIITQKCTYKCVYCSQSKCENKDKKDANKETIKAFIRFLDLIDKSFEITITGGEAILHPDFFSLIENIKNKGFKINLISNLSFNIKIYKNIFNLLNDSLNIFDISFHLDEIKNFKEAIEKLKTFLESKPKNTQTTIYIPIFELNKDKKAKIFQIVELAKKYNAKYSYQRIRIFNSHIKLKKDESEYFKEDSKIFPSFAKMCFSGYKSAVIYEDGNVYRCYSSRFLKSNFLGNIRDEGFKLNNKPYACTSKLCTCPKPKNYGQILNKKDSINAHIMNILNLFCLPYLVIKNQKILKIKLIQLLKNKISL